MNLAYYGLKIIIGALLYYALGKLGLLLVIPPGHATIFWPPAGIALAGVLFYGNKIWPAILIGAISTSLSHGAITLDAFLLATAIACGATLQALTGSYFIRNFLQRPFTLEQAKDILLVLFFGGMVSTAISATVGTGSLHLAGILSENAFARNWLLWYIGDAIGIFIFCPLFLILFARRKDVSRRRKALVGVSLTAMLLLVTALFFFVHQWEVNQEKETFAKQASEISKELKKEIAYYPQILHSIEDLFIASNKVTYEEFKAFTNRLMEKDSNISALSWNQKVLNADKMEFIEEMRAEGFPDFNITSRLIGERILASPSHAVYFPITYTVPYKENAKAHGFDTYSTDPINGRQRMETLNKARITGTTITTGLTSIVQSSDPYSLLIYHPIYHDKTLTGEAKSSMENLHGYASAALHVKAMVKNAVERANHRGMHLILYDKSAPSRRSLLFDSRTNDGKASATPLDVHPAALQHQSFFSFSGHGLEVLFLQKESAINKTPHILLWITLLCGLFFTGLLGILLLLISGRTEMFERMVADKASELQEAGNILEQSLNEIYIFDARSFHFLHINEGALRNLQYSLEELREMTPLDLKKDYDADSFNSLISPLRYDEEERLTFKTQHQRKDGTQYDVEVYLQKVFYQGDTAFLAIVMDITDKVKVEKTLRRQQHDMQVIFNNVPANIWYKDDKNTILRLNKAAAESMGGVITDFEGKDSYDLFPEKAKDYHVDDLEVIESGEPKLGIVEEYTPIDKERGWVLTNKVPYFDEESGRKGVFVVSQDITERVEAEANLEEVVDKLTTSNEELERFAYIASHDLQEPLRMVRNFTELLEKRYSDKIDDTAKSYIAIASSSAKHMQSLVDDLLDYARVEQSEDKIELLDPQQTLDYVKTSLHDRISKSNALISSDPFPTISVNPISFSCLMQNFIGNALKYIPKGTIPRIHIGVGEEKAEWIFSINDNGIGMKEEYLEQIFQPFKRLHTRDEYSGTGMGLAICRKTVENLGGRIWVESKEGVGSTFHFTVPKQEWEIEHDTE